MPRRMDIDALIRRWDLVVACCADPRRRPPTDGEAVPADLPRGPLPLSGGAAAEIDPDSAG